MCLVHNLSTDTVCVCARACVTFFKIETDSKAMVAERFWCLDPLSRVSCLLVETWF